MAFLKSISSVEIPPTLLNKLSLSQKLQKPLLAGCSLGWLLTPPNLPLPRGGAVGGGVFSDRWDRRNAVFSEICLTDSLNKGGGGSRGDLSEALALAHWIALGHE